MNILTKGLCSLALTGAISLTTLPTMAQENQQAAPVMPTLEDLIPGGATYRFTENLYGLQWWGDTGIKPGIDSLAAINPRNGKETLLVTREAINQALKTAGIPTQLPHLYSIQTPWPDETRLLISYAEGYATYDWKIGQATRLATLPRNAANRDFNTASGHVAYTIDNNLYVDGRAVTAEPQGVVCGQSVHRNEFGIYKGTFWSQDGRLLAFYRMDERMVSQYPLVDITARVGEENLIRYPMAGMTSHQVQVGIYNPETQKTVYLNTGDPTDRYFTNISWSPDGQSLFLIELNRDQNHSKLCRYNPSNGNLEAVLYEEMHDKYVEPQHPILFLPWDANQFIYQSQRSGWNHLYLFDLAKLEAQQPQELTSKEVEKIAQAIQKAGKGKHSSVAGRQLTSGEWLVQDVLGFNSNKKEVIIAATKESPLQSNLYKVNVKNGQITPLDNGEGVHQGKLSASGTYLIDNWSSPKVPRNIDLTSTSNGKQTACLLEAEDPFKGLVMPTIETGTLKAADGQTDLYWRMLKPADFDPNKQYPVIVYVYGGPHAQMINANWMYTARGWDLYMANKGYIMFTLDNRGSANRGLEFENCTFRHLGVEEGKDQVMGIEFLKSLPYVDSQRIGVHGWSFGGHMTTALMLRYPDIFKVGVAGGPVIDWSLYEVMYGERYMDTPQNNPEGYKETNLKNLAGQLKGHLMLIHDDHDDTCVPQHSLSFIKACIDARTYPDLFIYPGHKHNVMGRDRVHLHEKITRYFDLHL